MRLLRVIESADLAYGGPIEGARTLGKALVELGHRQDLLTLDSPGPPVLPDYPGEIFQLGPRPGWSPLRRYGYSPAFVPWLKAHAGDYDAVIVDGLWRYITRGSLKALAGGPVPYYVFPHGMLDPWFRKVQPIKKWGKQLSWWLAEGPLIRHAANVLFTTDEERLLAQDAFWPYHARGLTIGYGTADVAGDPAVQRAAFRAAFPAIGDRRYLLFLSRIHPKKGCDLLVDAFAAIAASAPDLDLVIAGPDQVGLVTQLKAQAERLGIVSRVHFPGMLKGDAKFGAFRDAEAFVLSSHQENFGIVVAEAMACATPVLISNQVNIWREIEADDAGLVEPDTVEGTKALLTKFLAMPQDERLAMGERARASFLARFHVAGAARAMLRVIESNDPRARVGGPIPCRPLHAQLDL